jgi:hypothetical protein
MYLYSQKTRGEPSSAFDLAASVAEEGERKPQQTFDVDARALKVFKALLYTPLLTATLGEIP